LGEVFQALNENNFNPRILYRAKLSFKIDGAIKVFHDKQKLKQYMTTNPPLQKILQRILHTESETQHNMKGQAVPNYRKRKSNKVESNIVLATHNQTLKQLRQLNDRNHHTDINTNI
jgi:phage gpG-like protein